MIAAIMLFSVIAVFCYLIKWDAEEIGIRVNILLGYFGVYYYPGIRVRYIIAICVFWLVYGVIFSR